MQILPIMAKQYSKYVCQQCGNEETQWYGKCPSCSQWGSLVETSRLTKKKGSKKVSSRGGGSTKPIKLSSIAKKSTKRMSTKISELDRVLGGGMVPGQVILLAGEPGIGKSTILLQLAEKLGNFLYVSGEESASQINIRAKRLGVKNKTINVLESTNTEDVIEAIEDSKDTIKCVVVDSIQTMQTEELSGMAGSVGQVRESSYQLSKIAKNLGIPIIIVGQVTKQGSVAGPATLMHLVDTVLWFEGEKEEELRILRANKNRFGATDEVGIFKMGDKGLTSISNPSKLFISKGKVSSGSVRTLALQGTRPILVEIQALVIPTNSAYPKRIAQGIDSKRLELLIAVLIKRCGIPLYQKDVFVNVTGGISIKDPSIDLAVCLSIASSYFDKAVEKQVVTMGEVGLQGDIRSIILQERREREAKRLGFKNVISSNTSRSLQGIVKNLLK